MVCVILSWIYIFLICTLIGIGILSIIKNLKFSWVWYFVSGVVVITVYVEIFSIFAKIGACAHMILLAAAVFVGVVKRDKIKELCKEYASIIFSWEGFFYCCFMLIVAYFTSRGNFHTDTNLYHAQAIRLYEEYGVLKGAGNLQLHFGYNSAYLAFASIFSLNWLFGQSLHTTTGLLGLSMCLYAFHGLKDFKQHKSHIADLMKIGILFYALVILTGSMSPATDYAAMFFALFVITSWCENLEGEQSVTVYALLAVAAVYTMTLKFSACLLVLLVIYPAVCLIKEKKWKEIIGYIVCGCIILCPFLIRNYFISGWLLYPFDAIDLFNVEWKVPKHYLLFDSDQIKVWGRCLYDIEKVDWSVFQWAPIWWKHQERYEQMLLGAAAISAGLQLVLLLDRIIKKLRFRWELAVLQLAIWGNLIVWFFMSPFIRYGLAFLFAVIMIAVGACISEKRHGLLSILTGGMMFCILVSVSPYWDHYITDAGVFIKQNLGEPYYLVQKDYDGGNMESVNINGNIIYYSTGGEVNSYHTYPGTCYPDMLKGLSMMGERLEDGFKTLSQ